MSIVRHLFRKEGYDLGPYTDPQIADALLDECPNLTDYWMTTAHLANAFRRLARQTPVSHVDI
jgi:hypothetical protein